MKKILAFLLAALMAFTCVSMIAAAEDVSEPETPTEPEQTVATYDFCEDPDFRNVVLMEKGNDKATIVHPGDKIKTYNTPKLVIEYYADADGMYTGDWTPADPNNLAFSISGQEVFREQFLSDDETPEGVVRDIDFTDYTIAYSDENAFVGWVVYEFKESTSSKTVVLVGVWEKNHKVSVADERDDLEYILNFFFNLRKKIAAPFLNGIKKIANVILFVKVWLYNLVFGAKTEA